MNRFILRDGQMITTKIKPDGLDVYEYAHGITDRTYMLLSDKAEVAFLLKCGEEANVQFQKP